MSQPKSLSGPFPTSWSSNDAMIHPENSLDQEVYHRRRLAWTARNPLGLTVQQTSISNNSDLENLEMFNTSKSYWGDIGIVGFRTVLDNQAHIIRRFIWFGVLMTCFALMLVQTLDRLNYFLAQPVSTSVRFIRNDSLMFPSITLCPYRDTLTRDASHLNPIRLQELYDQHFPEDLFDDPVEAMYKLADIYDVRTLWTLTGWDLEGDVSSCLHARTNCTLTGNMSKIFTVLGFCLHYHEPPVTISGHFYGFNIKLCNKNNRSRGIDKFYLMISDKYSTHDIRSLTHAFYLEQGWNKEVTVSLKHFQAENKQQAPCSPDQSKTVSRCISQCFHQTLVKKTGCRMPYMNSGDLASVPYCNTSEQLRKAEDLQKELLWEGRGWHPASCQCENSTTCSQYLYETSCDTFARYDNCAQYKVYFTDMTYEETREEFAYDIISLLCDIGGTLGLLLGASVIQFIDVISRQVVNWLTKGTRITKRRENSNLFEIVPSVMEPEDYR